MKTRFDVKIGSVTTPQDLSRVFQFSYMINVLGVNYESYSRKYVIRSLGNEGWDVNPTDEIVYLGLGRWKKNKGNK